MLIDGHLSQADPFSLVPTFHSYYVPEAYLLSSYALFSYRCGRGEEELEFFGPKWHSLRSLSKGRTRAQCMARRTEKIAESKPRMHPVTALGQIITIKVPLILKMQEIIFCAGKLLYGPFRWIF
jgi:hypothetical protein